MNLFQLAWRNLWRNARRTVVTIGAMTFGLWVMILYSGLMNGMLSGMEDDVLDYEVGDAQIQSPEYADDPSIYTTIDDSQAVIERVEAAGFAVSPRLSAGGLGASGEASAGIALRGIDVARDSAAMRLHERVLDGQWLDPAKPDEVVLGRRLGRILGAKPGSELIVLTQGSDGSMANALFTVRGVLAPVAEGTDRTAVFLNEQAWRDLMVMPEGFHQILVRKPADQPDDAFAAQLRELAPDDQVQTWREMMPMVAQMIDSAAGAVYLVFGIVYIAIGILILNAMLMAVFERIREFGVLKAIGVGPGSVFALIAIESAFQLLISAVVGVVLALPFAWYLSTSGLNMAFLGGAGMMGLVLQPIWYGSFGLGNFAGPLTVLTVIVSGAILYPAAKAALIQPLEAMRYQ